MLQFDIVGLQCSPLLWNCLIPKNCHWWPSPKWGLLRVCNIYQGGLLLPSPRQIWSQLATSFYSSFSSQGRVWINDHGIYLYNEGTLGWLGSSKAGETQSYNGIPILRDWMVRASSRWAMWYGRCWSFRPDEVKMEAWAKKNECSCEKPTLFSASDKGGMSRWNIQLLILWGHFYFSTNEYLGAYYQDYISTSCVWLKRYQNVLNTKAFRYFFFCLLSSHP